MVSGVLSASTPTVLWFVPKPDCGLWASRGDDPTAILTSNVLKKWGKVG